LLSVVTSNTTGTKNHKDTHLNHEDEVEEPATSQGFPQSYRNITNLACIKFQNQISVARQEKFESKKMCSRNRTMASNLRSFKNQQGTTCISWIDRPKTIDGNAGKNTPYDCKTSFASLSNNTKFVQ
jgi:hypothetical protein